jgi:ABC-type oligopeptide transport system ATPase subunit
VGESGCGKSTTARLLLRLIEPDTGEVYFERRNILRVFVAELKAYRRQVQMVFQDPYSSLNSRLNIDDAVALNALVHRASRPAPKPGMRWIRSACAPHNSVDAIPMN